MAQLVSILFFSVALIGAGTLITGMLMAEWDRVRAVLSGEAMERAQAQANPAVRVKLRSWVRAEQRQPARPLRAAA